MRGFVRRLKQRSEKPSPLQTFIYNDSGQVAASEDETTSNDWNPKEEMKYEYDDEGRLIRVTDVHNFGYGDSETFTDTLDISYEKDDLIKYIKRWYEEYESSEEDFFSYDEQGRLVKYRLTDKASKWTDEGAYTYSEDGKEMYNEAGAVYSLDGNGRLLRTSYAGNVSFECERDSFGFVTKQEEKSGDTTVSFKFNYIKHLGPEKVDAEPVDFDETKLGSNGQNGSWAPKGAAYLDHYADYVAGAVKPGVTQTYFYFGGPA